MLACLPSAVASSSAPVLHLTFDDGAARGTPVSPLHNTGTEAVALSVVRSHGGTIVHAASRAGSGSSALFPAFDGSADGPRAIIRATRVGGDDNLDPGTGRLRFGAQIWLRKTSQSSGSAHDNGNNVVQRGLSTDSTQWKLQVDDAYPSCRIEGAAGSVLVVASTKVSTQTWYRLSCLRQGATVTLAVTRFLPAGTAITETYTRHAATGSLRPRRASTPLSIGGKLNADGSIATASDQFNGRIDDVRVKLG